MTATKRKITTGEIKRLYANLHKANLTREELTSIVSENTQKIADLLEPTCPWSFWYDRPLNHLFLIFFTCTGMLEEITRICRSDHPDSEIIDYMESEPDIDSEDEYDNEEKAFISSLGVAIFNQALSLSMFGEYINSMVLRAKNGDDSALFDAILVDRSVLATPSIAKRIQIADLTKDESFFNQLANAITRTRPRRPSPEYDDARFMLTALDECKSFSAKNNYELHKLIVDNLELYPSNRKDSFKGFEKMLQRLRKRQRDTK
jgi:hypothetical protein